MELQKVIDERRSIRKYDDSKEMTREQMETIFRAAGRAPSWKNQQTTRYYCVMSADKKEAFREACLPGFNRERSAHAGALIIVAFEKNNVGFMDDHETPINEIGNGWGMYDAGIQTENILLKAKEMGFGTLVMGIRHADKIREFLSIPENQEILSVIAVGYPAEWPDARPRKEMDEIAVFL